jgi:hypothetical protein
MEHSPSWEANTNSASQEILRFLSNPKIHFRVHKGPPQKSLIITTQIDLFRRASNNLICRLLFVRFTKYY